MALDVHIVDDPRRQGLTGELPAWQFEEAIHSYIFHGAGVDIYNRYAYATTSIARGFYEMPKRSFITVVQGILCIISLTVVIGGWLVSQQLKQVRNGYGEWGLAEMIIAYANDHDGKPPMDWEDLSGYENRASHLITSWDFATVKTKFQIDFTVLHSLSNGDIDGKSQQVISTIGGRAIDLGGARPNSMLTSYFTSGIIPERAMIFGEWTSANDGTRREWIEFERPRKKGELP